MVVGNAVGNLDCSISILQNLRAGELWCPGDWAAGDSAAGELQAIIDVVHKRGTHIREVAAGGLLKLGTTESRLARLLPRRRITREPQAIPSSCAQPVRTARPCGLGATSVQPKGRAPRGFTGLAGAALVIDRPGLTEAARSGLLHRAQYS